MQPIRTIWTILVEDYPGTIPVKFGKISISGWREDVVWSFPYINQNCDPRGGINFNTKGIIWTTLEEDL